LGIVLIIETQQNNEHNVCIGHEHYATRTRDPDEAAAAYRAAATRCGIEARITPQGRVRGNGIKLAYEGIDVSFDTLDEREERDYAHEIAWADQSAGLARVFSPELARLAEQFRKTHLSGVPGR
jgi:hypothetical protein